MIARLRLLRSYIALVFIVFAYSQTTFGQFFQMNYSGPDTIFVGNDCQGEITANGSDLTISSTVGASVSWAINWTLTGYDYGDWVTAGTIVTIVIPVSDNLGNFDTLSYDLVYWDNITPVFDAGSLPPDNLFFNHYAQVTAPANVTATDNCGNTSIVFSQTTIPDTCAGGSFFRHWTATDDFGNSVSHTQTLIINPDNAPPHFTSFPTDGSTACEAYLTAYPTWLNNTMNSLDADDLFGIHSITHNAPDVNSLSFDCDTSFVVTFTATDSCGHTATTSANYSIYDNTDPLVHNKPADATYSCDAITPPLRLNDGLIIDDCDDHLTETYWELSTQDTDVNSCNHYNYTITRNWSIQDHCNNEVFFQQIVTVVDSMHPVFPSAPTDTTVLCHAIPDLALIPAQDLCDLTPDVTISQSTTLGNCINEYSLLRKWTATDACGNSDSVFQTIQVIDTVAPSLLNIPQDVVVNCHNIPEAPIISAADLCDTDVFIFPSEISTQSSTPSDCSYHNYSITRTWAATDNCNNTISGSQIITVVDDEPPSIITPNDFIWPMDSAECGITQALPSPLSFYDDCTGTRHNDTLTGTTSLSNPPGSPIGTTPVNETIVLTSNLNIPNQSIVGNIILQIDLLNVDGEGPDEYFQIVVEDSIVLGQTNPTDIECGLSTTVFTNISTEELSLWLMDGSLQLSFLSNALGADAINNICSNAEIQVRLSYTYNEQQSPLDLYYSINDQSPKPFPLPTDHYFPEGEHTISYLAVDCSGNADTSSFQIVVTDQEAPELTCPPDMTVFVDANTCEKTISLPWPIFSDNCTPANNLAMEMQYAVGTGNLLPLTSNTEIDLIPASYAIEYRTKDLTDLTGHCIWQIHVLDTIPPEAIATNSLVYVNPSGSGNTSTVINPEDIDFGSTDNCDIVSMSLSPNSFTCLDAGNTYEVVLSVEDASGNMAYDTALVQVKNEAPEPVFSQGVCGNDTLFLFANPPSAQGNVYTYEWQGQNGFSSFDANPFIPNPTANHAGTYSVTITGFTGCSSAGTVQVGLNVIPDNPVLEANQTSLCVGESLVLSTQSYAGNVNYQWYAGLPPNGSLIGSTPSNAFTLSEPPEGQTSFYASVQINGCPTGISNIVTIDVYPTPMVTVAHDSMTACTGTDVVLSVSNPQPTFTYEWSGPNVFVSNDPTVVLTEVEEHQEGTYVLFVTEHGCISQADTAFVAINPTPAIPIMDTNSPVCAGDTLEITIPNYSDVTTQIYWVLPDGDTTITMDSVLQLVSDVHHSGAWNVFGVDNQCPSSPGEIDIFVPEVPVVAIDDPGIICEGSPVQLAFVSSPAAATQIWSGPNFQSYLPSPTTLAMQGTYSVQVTTSSGCKDSAQIEINPKPIPVITALSNTADGCFSGESIQLKPTIFPPDTTYQYDWSGPNFSVCCDITEPIISNADETIIGYYQLIVTDGDGCISEPKTTLVEGVNQPLVPEISSQTLAICEGEVIEIDIENELVYGNDSTVIHWLTPKGTLLASSYSLIIQDAGIEDEGTYFAIASVNGCASDTSGGIFVTVNPRPNTPILSSNSPVCVGDSIKLESSVLSGVTYQWSGPGGFDSDLYNPVIPNASNIHDGLYYLQLNLAGCSSPLSAPLDVQVKDLPTQPVIQLESPICLTGGLIQLDVNESSQVQGATYEWFSDNDQSIAAPSFLSSYENEDLSAYSEGAHGFYVVTAHDGCTSISEVVTIQMDAVPGNQSDAGLDIEICDHEEILLQGQMPSVGTGYWTQLCGPSAIITNPDNSVTTIQETIAGESYCFEWALSFGGCINYDRDTIDVQVNTKEYANAGPFVDTCLIEQIHLNAVQPAFSVGQWSQTSGQENMGVKIVESFNPNSLITGLKPGKTYNFYWTLNDIGCGATTDTVNIRIAGENVFAGFDQSICSSDTCVYLQAASLQGTTDEGEWTTTNGLSMIATPQSEETEACGLAPGANVYVWTINGGACGALSRDTVIINFQEVPVAHDDIFHISFAQANEFDIVANDDVLADFSIEIVSPPQNGTIVDVTDDGRIIYQVTQDFLQNDALIYRLCASTCDECDEASVTFRVGDKESCIFPNVLTPDFDGINDQLVIPCLVANEYPNVKLSIFTQSGQEVYYSEHYQNDWGGTYNGSPLPEGYYFYQVEFGLEEPSQKGFILLKY